MLTSPARVARAWVAARRGVASVLIGASRPEQIAENIAILDVAQTPAQLARLDADTRRSHICLACSRHRCGGWCSVDRPSWRREEFERVAVRHPRLLGRAIVGRGDTRQE